MGVSLARAQGNRGSACSMAIEIWTVSGAAFGTGRHDPDAQPWGASELHGYSMLLGRETPRVSRGTGCRRSARFERARPPRSPGLLCRSYFTHTTQAYMVALDELVF